MEGKTILTLLSLIWLTVAQPSQAAVIEVSAMFDYSKGDFSLLFTTSDGKLINTRNLFFDVQTQFGNTITLSKDDEQTIDFVLQGSSGKIVKSLHFKNGTYGFDADIKFLGLHDAIANYEYQIVWENGLRYAEDNSVDESKEAKAFSFEFHLNK